MIWLWICIILLALGLLFNTLALRNVNKTTEALNECFKEQYKINNSVIKLVEVVERKIS